MLAKKCAHCSTPFHSSRSDAAFCSKTCRNKFDYWLRSRRPGQERSLALIEEYRLLLLKLRQSELKLQISELRSQQMERQLEERQAA